MSRYYYDTFPKYIPVAERRAKAARQVSKLRKQGKQIAPVVIEGRLIAKTFWGRAWCRHIESFSDYRNRLPRGRSYVRHGSVIDLKMEQNEVTALVYGGFTYNVTLKVAPLTPEQWQVLVATCAGKIDSLIELLQGRLSTHIMEIMTDQKKGLFPKPAEMTFTCSCPDWAKMCKHVAAVMYGIGAYLDDHPEALFSLRQVDHTELITVALTPDDDVEVLSEKDLSAIFGIEIEARDKQTHQPKSKKKGVSNKAEK